MKISRFFLAILFALFAALSGATTLPVALLHQGPTPLSKAAADLLYVHVQKPERFGAKADGVHDDAPACQAAVDALPASGGVIYLGVGTYRWNSEVHTDKTVFWQGCGSGFLSNGLFNLTTIACSSPTANGLRLGADNVGVFDIAFENTSSTAPTAGVGLYLMRGAYSHVERCSFVGFYDCVEGDQAFLDHFSHNIVYNEVRYGYVKKNVTVYDEGDSIFDGNVFLGGPVNRPPAAMVEWESGGGLKFTGNKCNAGANAAGNALNGLHVALATGTTAVMVVTGNSFENITYPVHFEGGSSANRFANWLITDNEFALASIGIMMEQGFNLQNWTIANDTFSAISDVGVRLLNAQRGSIQNLVFEGTPTLIQQSGGCAYNDLELPNPYYDCILLNNDGADSTSGADSFAGSQSTYEMARELVTGSGAHTYYTLVPCQYSAGTVEAVAAGVVSGVGAGVAKAEWPWIHNGASPSGGTAPQVSGPYNNYAYGIGLTLALTPSAGSPDSLAVQATSTSGSGLSGRLHVRLTGNLRQVRRGI